jgi:hypothetical protein
MDLENLLLAIGLEALYQNMKVAVLRLGVLLSRSEFLAAKHVVQLSSADVVRLARDPEKLTSGMFRSLATSN